MTIEERTCKVCQETLPIPMFTPILKAGKVYYSWTCKPCRNDLLWRNEQSRKTREQCRKFNALVGWPAL